MSSRQLLQHLLSAYITLSCAGVLPLPASAETNANELETTPASAAAASPKSEQTPTICFRDASKKPVAVVLCLHGLGLHKGTFSQLGQRLAADGIVTYAIDLPGFGAWLKEGEHTHIDFDRTLSEVKLALEQIHKDNPNLPVVLLGESMGGAVALHATALYPNLVSGLISSVPAGDRFGQTEEELKVGIHALLKGFNSEMAVGRGVVNQATQKEDLRKAWEDDPLARMSLSPKELMDFQAFMNKNFACAHLITSTPVLFIQGAQDKLVRPAGTWKLFESLGTPNRELVFSKSAEHLIFEEGQFGASDIAFVEGWLTKHLSGEFGQQLAQQIEPPKATEQVTTPAPATPLTDPVPDQMPLALSYWIELYRDGKIYRCNNKSVFKTGDAIRFHLTPATDGYAYIVMKLSSTGKQAVLFPEPHSGLANAVNSGSDYAVPTKAWLKFDEHAGVEKVTLIYSRQALDLAKVQNEVPLTAYISSDRSGSKDLVPTRMQLSWDDPEPVIIPTEFSSSRTSAETVPSASVAQSLVRVSQAASGGALAVDIALTHL